MRKTKILVTLGPATDSPAMLEQLIENGANIFRLNMSHASHDWVRTVNARIRDAAKAKGTDVAILMDLTGPSIRTGDVPAPWMLNAGDEVEFRIDESLPPTKELSTTVNYPGLVNDLTVGAPIAIDGGMIQMQTVGITPQRIFAKVLTGCEMKSRRHINLPGVEVTLPPLTPKE